jgi:hypothetical protein
MKLALHAGDGGNKARLSGETTKETVKTIARGMPDVFGVTVVTYSVCFFHLHPRLRARRAPGIPCALIFLGRTMLQNPGVLTPREGKGVAYTFYVVPDKRGEAERDPGPITADIGCGARLEQQLG